LQCTNSLPDLLVCCCCQRRHNSRLFSVHSAYI